MFFLVTVLCFLVQMLIKVSLAHRDPNVHQVARKTELALPVFPIRAAPRLPVFVCPIIASSLFVLRIQSKCSVKPASCVCLSPQNTTDSSSNSSQKLESSLQPLESSPLPQRHKCMLGHRHDLHDPYRLSDHYFLDQVRQRTLAMPRKQRTRCSFQNGMF